MSNPVDEAIKVLNETLIWKLNKNLHKIYLELFQRLNLSSTEAAKARAKQPGEEVVFLLNLLMNKEGKSGLHRFYVLLQELKQTASLELIDNSVAVILFKKPVVNPEQQASEKTDESQGIPNENDGEISGTILLSDMKPTDLEVIINQCASTEGWKKLALCFGSLKVNHEQLEVGYKKSDNRELCEALFLILSDRGITIKELARAFEDKRVGLNLLADQVRNIARESNVSPKQGEPLSTTGSMTDTNKAAVYLFELHSLDLDGLAKECHTKSKEMWKIAGEYFGNESRLKELESRNPNSNDEDRSKILFNDLAGQGITLKELALFLKHDEIGLASVAKVIWTAKYRKRNIPVALQTNQQLTNQPTPVHTDRTLSNQKEQGRVPYYFSWPAQGQRLIDPSEQLEKLHDKLANNTVVAIVGLSGFGKSTLSKEYGYRYVSNYQFAVWIDCKNDTALVASYYRLSKWLGVDTSNQTHSVIPLEEFITKEHVWIAQVKDYLQEHKCLVVFDDCNNWETLKIVFNHLMPTNALGNIIITSQIVEWNVQINAKVGLFNMQEVQYEEDEVVKYLQSVARNNDTSNEDARAIYHMYKGFTMAYYLVACYVSDGRTLRYFREQAEEQKINVTNDVPLFMLISSFDGELLLLMRVLAILYSADVQCLADLITKDLWRKHEKTDNFVDKFQASIKKSLISLTRVNDELTLVNIGHDIVRDYLLKKMSLPAFEVLVDKCMQENFHYWQLRQIVRQYHSKNLEHGSDMTTINKLVEIAILWEQPFVNRLAAEFGFSRSNYPHHLRLIELTKYPHLSSEDYSIVDFFKTDGNDWLASLASYQLKKLSGDWSQPVPMKALDINESDKDDREVKGFNKNLREKHDQLRLMIQLERGKWLVRQGQTKEGIEQLKACYEYRRDNFGLFRRNTNVAHIKLMRAQLASDDTSVKLEALKLFKQLIATANITLDLSCRDAAQLLVDACKKLPVSPQLLDRPDRKSNISDDDVLKMMQEERRKTTQKRCTLDDPSLSLIQLDHNMFQFGLGTHVIFMCKLAIFPQAQLPIAFLEAIEPSFPLITLRLEALYLIAEALESAIGWEKIKEKCLALNVRITSNMDRLPRLKFTPERKSSTELDLIFMQILELACRYRYSVQKFIDWLKSLEVSDELMERLQQQLYDTHLAPADFVVESTRLKYDFARDTR